MTIKYTAIAALLAVSACSGAPVPDSNPNVGGGVGFGSYDAYSAQQLARQRAARDAALEGAQVQVPVSEEQSIAQDTLGVLNQTSPDATSAQPVQTAALGTAPVTAQDNPCLLYTSPSPRDLSTSRMPSSA